MRLITAGESHGLYNVAILEGFPKGVKVQKSEIDKELARRMSGFGRGGRMKIEKDSVDIVSGMRNKITLGSPIALLIKNKDARIFTQKKDGQAALTVPRPAHADLAGALKYGESDVRNILERSSARETVARVAAGSVCKQLLAELGVKVASFTISVGNVTSSKKPSSVNDILKKAKTSKVNAIDVKAEKQIIKAIKEAQKNKDSLGGIVEVWADGLVAGLGSVMHYDKRLDAKLASSLMSIPAVKGVELGLGFEYSKKCGSQSHDAIMHSKSKGFHHKSNNSGGIEGGMTNGEVVVARIAMKPIATLLKPLMSVSLKSKKKAPAVVERSDTCAIVALGVIAESMMAIELTDAIVNKFGCDSLKEIKANLANYKKSLK